MLDTVLPYAKAVVCIEPPNPRALPVAELAQAVREAVAAAPHVDQRAANVLEAATIERGVNAARMLAGPDGLVVAFGSLYSIGDIMRALAN
jgi:dihydrofolate synthase/folylpolyglutamate synthase